MDKILSIEIGRLAQGNDYGVTVTDTTNSYHVLLYPRTPKSLMQRFIVDYHPFKPEPNRLRCVAGGDKLDYICDSNSPTTTLTETKNLFNSGISHADKGAKFMTCDLNDHFLASQMKKVCDGIKFQVT